MRNKFSLALLICFASFCLNSQIINTIAGGAPPANGVLATNTTLAFPSKLAIAPNGNLFFSEELNYTIRKISTNGLLTIVAGNGASGYTGDGGFALNASLYSGSDIAFDQFGNYYITDVNSHVIRKVSVSGIISTIAGTGVEGDDGEGGPAILAKISRPKAIAIDGSGIIYFADAEAYKIKKIEGGIITTIGGNGNNGYSGDNGQATLAEIGWVNGIGVNSFGEVIFSQGYPYVLRKISTNGVISTIAGNGISGYSGDGGMALMASLNGPESLTIDNLDNIYFCDASNNVIRKINTFGIISTIAGTGDFGYNGDGGQAINAKIYYPSDIVADQNGNVFFADQSNNRIRKIAPSGVITTIAGTVPLNNIPGLSAQLIAPLATLIGKNGDLYISEGGNFVVRKLAANGVISTFAGTGHYGFSGNGGLATNAELRFVYDMALDTADNLYLAGEYNDSTFLRKIDKNGVISIAAGTGIDGFSGDGGLAISAQIHGASGVCTDQSGNVYFTDGNRIRKINANGIITTIAGTGNLGYSGDGGLAINADFSYPSGIEIDAAGNLYISQSADYVIRKIAVDGIVTTIAGNGAIGFSGDGGLAINAQLEAYAERIAVTSDGTLFIADAGNQVIRMVTPAGIISTIAGLPMNSGFSGDGGASFNAKLSSPVDIEVDPTGLSLFISDMDNNRIRKISNLPIPEICMVSVDSISQNNEVFWDKTNYFNIDSFIVYRETSSSPSVYSKIGAVSFDSLSTFKDTSRTSFLINGDPNISTYRYKVQLLDNGGNYSFMSNYHNSIYISNSGSNFSWNTYEIENTSSPFSYYQLLRDDFATGTWSVVGTTSASQTQLNDPNYSTYQNTANWNVIAVGPTCFPTLRNANDGKDNEVNTIVVRSKSNIKNNRTVGIKDSKNQETRLKVYPNPANEMLNVEVSLLNDKEATIVIENMLGQVVYSQQPNKQLNQLNISTFVSGVYFVKLSAGKGVAVEKIIIE